MIAAGRVLAVDLGGTRLRAAISPTLHPELCLDLAHGAGREQPLSTEQLVDWLRDAVTVEPIAAIGVSVAGTVEADTGVVTVADNLGWRDQPLGAILRDAFAVPVGIDTDTFCGARAEAHYGGGQQGNRLYIAIGTGIGHAWLLHGHLWRGAGGAASMFGHLIVHPGGRTCYCGNRGCLCQYAAGPVVGPALAALPATSAAMMVEEANQALALALAQALTLMNPDQVILGGALAVIWPDLDDLQGRIRDLVHPEVRPIAIRRSELGASANLLGAGLLAAEARHTERFRRSRTESG